MSKVAKLLSVSLVAMLLGVWGTAAPSHAVEFEAPTLYVALGVANGVGGSCATPDYGSLSYAEDPDDTIQAAIDASVADGVVHVCAGTWLLDSDGVFNVDDQLSTKGKGLVLRGDGRDETILQSTALSGRRIISTVDGGGENPAAITIEDMELRGGNVEWDGGAVYASEVSCTDSDFADNESSLNGANGYGGAIYATESFNSSGCNFTDNAAAKSGGAIWSGGSLEVVRGAFTRNTAEVDGGAVFAVDDTSIDDSSFRQNESATAAGGAIFVSSASTVRIEQSSFSENEAEEAGAVNANADDVTISAVNFSSNVARVGSGGALQGEVESITVESSRFAENEASGSGGALALGGDELVSASITFSSFQSNGALDGRGGAVYLWEEVELVISKSAFERNTSSAEGGAVSSEGAITIDNSSFKLNESSDEGAGAIWSNVDVDATDSLYVGNSAENGWGGAIWATHDITLVRTVLETNAGESGGAIYAEGMLSVDSSVFRENTAVSAGGAAYAEGYAEVINSSFDANEAGGDGGALYAQENLDVVGSSFEDNDADNEGGAIYSLVANDVTVNDSAFSGNTAVIADDNDYNLNAVDSGCGVVDLDDGDLTGGSCAHHIFYVSLTEPVSDDSSCSDPGFSTIANVLVDDDFGDGDVIALCPGTYLGNIDLELAGGDDVSLVGLAGTGGDVVIDGAGSDQLLDVSGNGSLAIVGIEFSNGDADNEGAAVRLVGTTDLVAVRSTFDSNYAFDGGAIFGETDVVLVRGEFTLNSAEHAFGGAVRAIGDAWIVDSLFNGNVTLGADGPSGGGAVYADDIHSIGSFYADNDAINRGGALFASGVLTSVKDEFLGNTSGSEGGAVRVVASSSIVGATFTDNECGNYGGALSIGDGGGDFNFIDLAAVGNTAPVSGSVSDNDGANGSVVVVEGSYQDNISYAYPGDPADRAGAILQNGGDVTLVGGLYEENESAASGSVVTALRGIVLGAQIFDNVSESSAGAMYMSANAPNAVALIANTITGNLSSISGAGVGAVGGTGNLLSVANLFEGNTGAQPGYQVHLNAYNPYTVTDGVDNCSGAGCVWTYEFGIAMLEATPAAKWYGQDSAHCDQYAGCTFSTILDADTFDSVDDTYVEESSYSVSAGRLIVNLPETPSIPRSLSVSAPRFGAIRSSGGFACTAGAASCLLTVGDEGRLLSVDLPVGTVVLEWIGCSSVEGGVCRIEAGAQGPVAARLASSYLLRFAPRGTRLRATSSDRVPAIADLLKMRNASDQIELRGYSATGGSLASARAERVGRLLTAAGVSGPFEISGSASLAPPGRRAKVVAYVIWGTAP